MVAHNSMADSLSAKHRRLPHKLSSYLISYQTDSVYGRLRYRVGFLHALPASIALRYRLIASASERASSLKGS